MINAAEDAKLLPFLVLGYSPRHEVTSMHDTLARLATFAPQIPGQPSESTVYRWAVLGLHDGKIKLRTVKIGGRRFTSEVWVKEFVEALNQASASK